MDNVDTNYRLTGEPSVSREDTLAFLEYYEAVVAWRLADGIYEAARRLRYNNPDRVDEILDPAMGVMQMIHETGWGYYGGASRPYNPAGIKKRDATGDTPDDFEIPSTPFDGGRMHVNHVSAYTGGPVLGIPHGRYGLALMVNEGKPPVRYLDELVGRWATDTRYTDKIKTFYDRLLKFVELNAPEVEVPEEELPEVSTTAFAKKEGWKESCRITRRNENYVMEVVGVYRKK